jgi:putative addiction module killer protein
MGYTVTELEVRQTQTFARWFARLRDREARARVLVCIRRLSLGSFGHARSVGGSVSEVKIDYGPGYRLYITRRGRGIVVLLAGGDKRTQERDIAISRRLARDL